MCKRQPLPGSICVLATKKKKACYFFTLPAFMRGERPCVCLGVCILIPHVTWLESSTTLSSNSPPSSPS